MDLSGSIFWVAAALGILDLVLGWLLGRYWTLRRTAASGLPQPSARALHDTAQRLADEVANVHQDVHQHQARMEQVNDKLLSARSRADDQLAHSVLESVADILRINAHLQDRLIDAEEKLQDQGKQVESWMTEARTDPLTRLPNRRAFDSALARHIALWQRTAAAFSVMIVDADQFKTINDRHGHPIGDLVLRGMAEVLERTLRKADVIARIGGEEFAVILANAVRADACLAAEHCRTAVESYDFRRDDLNPHPTISLGVAFMQASDTAASITERADEALYAAKQAGRNRVYVHDGAGCRPAIPAAAPERDSAPRPRPECTVSEPVQVEGADLAAACGQLRDELAQVIGKKWLFRA
ncbi:MAG: GGDEF domain-containing protein [Thermoguttaceae bacterium]